MVVISKCIYSSFRYEPNDVYILGLDTGLYVLRATVLVRQFVRILASDELQEWGVRSVTGQPPTFVSVDSCSSLCNVALIVSRESAVRTFTICKDSQNIQSNGPKLYTGH